MLLLDTRHTPHIRIHTTHMLHMRTTLQTLQRTALLPPPSHLFHQPTSWYQLTLAGTNEQEFSLKYVILAIYRVGGRNVRLGAGHIQRPEHPH